MSAPVDPTRAVVPNSFYRFAVAVPTTVSEDAAISELFARGWDRVSFGSLLPNKPLEDAHAWTAIAKWTGAPTFIPAIDGFLHYGPMVPVPQEVQESSRETDKLSSIPSVLGFIVGVSLVGIAVWKFAPRPSKNT